MTVVFFLSGVIYYLLISHALIHELDETLARYKEKIQQYAARRDALPIIRTFEEVEINYQRVSKFRKKKYSMVNLYDQEEHKTGKYRQLIFCLKVKANFYEIRIAKPIEGTKLLTNTIALTTLVLLLFVIIISILINHFLLKKLWAPFYKTMGEMKGFKLSNKVLPKLPETEIEEFSLMNYSLSEVISIAKDDYRILKEFTENASHEMQTPIAIIRSKLDLMIQEEGISENQSNALSSIYAGIHRLTKLNQSLLLLAKIENQQFSETEKIDMKQKTQEKLNQFNELWEGKKLLVITELNDSVMSANPELVDIFLNNLLSNAGNHNLKDHGRIEILLLQGELRISNTGRNKGLNEKKIFSRFYKEDQYSQHNGLGLSIVKQICERMDIRILYEFEKAQHTFSLSWRE